MAKGKFIWQGRAFRALVLDMDGTLVDTERILLEMWDTVSREMGYVFSREDMLATIGTSYRDTQRRMVAAYPAAPHEEIRAETSRRFKELRERGGVTPKQGAVALLEAVTAAGAQTALCTSSRRPSVELTLASAGLSRYFTIMVCGDEAAKGKPDPAPYLLAAERLGIDPADCLAVEDSPQGARSALDAGMAVAVVPDLIPVPADVAARAAAIPADLRELAEQIT